MTLIAIWVDNTPKTETSIWAVADTKITDGRDTLMLEGAKLLELPIRCKNIGSLNREIYYTTSLGYAFAGSSLTAFNAYAMLSTVFSNLGGLMVRNVLPDYKSLVDKARDILKLYTMPATHCRFAEIAVYGFCPKSRLPFIGTIRPNKSFDDYDIEIQYGKEEHLTWCLLGDTDAKSKANDMIKSSISKFNHNERYEYWRLPFYPIREVVKSNDFGGVGGSLQLTNLSRSGYGQFYVLTPSNIDFPSHNMVFRNLDIYEDIGRSVGDCVVDIHGMDMDYPHS